MNKLKELETYISNNKTRAVEHCKQIFVLNKLSDEHIFYMAVFCLLVPAGNAKKTHQCVMKLQQLDYINRSIDDISLYSVLKPYIRFPRQKAVRLHSFKRISKGFIKILRKEFTLDSNEKLRQGLVDRVSGMGYKAASHFLRNLGVQDLAIIDTHILKYRPYFMPENLKEVLPTSQKNYLLLEKYFRLWAKELNLSVAHLDWLIWCKESGNDVTALDC